MTLYMEIKLLEIAGINSVYKALHLPFGKGKSEDEDKDNTLIE